MNDLFFVICSFSLLWVLESLDSKENRFSPAPALSFLRDGFQLFAALVLFTSLYFLALKRGVSTPFVKEAWIFIWPVVYGLCQIFRKHRLFFVTLLGFSFFILNKLDADTSLTALLFEAGLLCFGLTLFRLGMEGLRWKILFSNVPAALQPVPITLIAGALLAMALSWLTGVSFSG